MSKVAAATEEAAKEVKRVMRTSAIAALAMLGQAFVAVLVVDPARFGLRESLVSVCYLDKFFVGRFVTAVIRVNRVLHLQGLKGGNCLRRAVARGKGHLTGFYQDEIFCLMCDMLS